MSEEVAISAGIWRALLVISLTLILYEMTKWFMSRTTSYDRWFDSPKLEPPGEEIESISAEMEYLSESTMTFYEMRQRIFDAITDNVTLTLGLDESELRKGLLDKSFVEKNFGAYAHIVSHLSEDLVVRLATPLVEKARTGRNIDANTILFEMNKLLDKVDKWEKKHENKRDL
nr:hypothetical protein [Candidatus Njordarchaeota archaeon]